eukprot:CAMPEP_0117473676 /NCGR_PEP_ID=MMETSP0784-20121206/8891_1 /TAXON_ID=39447 /ORGANISM="" /LENGTH=469 /DNA_ID=CAMNT_0005267877 /DNA_START=18 /DNA_END=1427 /DNA_ORIENTATION=-
MASMVGRGNCQPTRREDNPSFMSFPAFEGHGTAAPSERCGVAADIIEDLYWAGPKAQAACSPRRHYAASKLATADREARFAFWVAVCENAAASEVAVNLCLPWLLCQNRGGAIHAPSDIILNSLVLLLNLVSAYVEGFVKSTRIFSQTLRGTRIAHNTVFMVSNGISLGFLNVSSSFPDVGGGASDVALATGTVFAGSLYVLLNMLGSVALYRFGRLAGWRCVRNRWGALHCFCRLWPCVVRGCLLGSFVFVFVCPLTFGYEVPLDLNDPEIGGIENVRLVYDAYEIDVPPAPLGLAFGILMSTTGCILATLICDIWLEERQRSTARLAINVASTAAVLGAQQLQYIYGTPGFVLMKFSSSFCGALSAFSGTIGDVFDAIYGTPEDEPALRNPTPSGCEEKVKVRRVPIITGAQNFMVHLSLTLAIMLLGVMTGPVEVPPIVLQPRASQSFAQETFAVPWHVDTSRREA